MTNFYEGQRVTFKTKDEFLQEQNLPPESPSSSIKVRFGINDDMFKMGGKSGIIIDIDKTIQKVFIEFDDKRLTDISRRWSISGEMLKPASDRFKLNRTFFTRDYIFQTTNNLVTFEKI